MKNAESDIKKEFMKKGSCSQALCFFLDREFGCRKEPGERAADPLAGGVLLQGHQCGMLWGSSLAVGAESFRRFSDRGRATAAAVSATAHLMKSYSGRTGSVNCRDVCGHDFTNKIELFAFMMKFILHINRDCLDLADKWVPEAIRSASEGLSAASTYAQEPVSCASVLAKKMGAGDEEAAMVAGFAGGLGLSGNGCGALAAAVWLKSLAWCRENPGKSSYNNPYAKKMLKSFFKKVGTEMSCRTITGQRFETLDAHTKFIRNGGCEQLINVLAES
ncbi:MAG TPA: C-GCAxxG-C-C family protein [Spirochaetota bacterium]|nr:C-GCAxxG-C-C family protein [Spirochaetota bacterium]HPC41393.1 C-GCAxxG-C-C family protein [Spirochaetota bacterium]HQF09225.1 C-GCAxxG-C-C family protein [Spirochaetota bacterium]HQH97766.1 C-GCAxxG-C-C family protein [Spirochaetota bacterium]HQJ71469.1 C-GCAxxG-C-C family protein [Spirochaetota bacterium]